MSASSSSDYDPSDEILSSAFPPNPFSEKACPVCSKLDLHAIVSGNPDGCGQEYCIEPSQHDRDMLHEWIEECSLCRLICDLDKHWSDHGDDDQPLQYDSKSYCFACRRGCSGRNGLSIEILADWDSFLNERLHCIAVHAEPLSEGSIARMRHWVTRCDKSDAACRVRDAALPTRVLDVDDLQSIKLCDTDDFTNGQQQSYIALSHCWGLPNKTFLTTRDTIAEMRAGFPIGDAPATFRDAIQLTRCLGIRYLWIDSLCIIQRDDEDWKLEASRMGSVYANSFLTIAAANAKDDNDGFLHPRVNAKISLKITSSTGRSAQVYLEAQIDCNDRNRNPPIQPLDTRGWALQERYLSQRTLEFGSTQMSWECQCFRFHESETGRSNNDLKSIRLLQPRPTDSGGLSYSSWYTMISSFTGRKLTKYTDKLPALSGLATEVAKSNQGIYYAGLWWEDMGSGLLWYRVCALELDESSAYLAPSWSWASLNGRIVYEDQPAKVVLGDVAFHECYLERENGNLYGAVKSGWLDLSAPLVKLKKCKIRENYIRYDDGRITMFRFADLDGPVSVKTFYSGNSEARGNLDLTHKDHVDVLGLLLMFSTKGTEFTVDTPIISPAVLSGSSLGPRLYGIVIEKSSIGPLAYKRIGYFSANFLGAGEVEQILKGAEVQKIRLY